MVDQRSKKVAKLLKPISPKWASVIATKGINRAIEEEKHKVGSVSLNICKPSRCIVGEAWGFSSAYDYRNYCAKCLYAGAAFTLPHSFAPMVTKFVEHFKEAHKK